MRSSRRKLVTSSSWRWMTTTSSDTSRPPTVTLSTLLPVKTGRISTAPSVAPVCPSNVITSRLNSGPSTTVAAIVPPVVNANGPAIVWSAGRSSDGAFSRSSTGPTCGRPPAMSNVEPSAETSAGSSTPAMLTLPSGELSS